MVAHVKRAEGVPGRSGNRKLSPEPLALHGGTPVRKSYLPYGHQWIDEDDIAAVIGVLRSEWLTTGPVIAEFEEAVADYCGARYGVAFSSGTAALHAACAAAGLGPGDEAITTPLTFVATTNAVIYCGAKPVWADIQRDTLNIDPEEIQRRITPRTKAILPVDFAGLPADLDAIKQIAKANDLLVIEDAAHALGARYKGQKVGNLSDMTVFSFHPAKHITTGEGGMVLTSEKRFYQRLKEFRHHGIMQDRDRLVPSEGSWYYEIHDLGYNFRISDFQCAMGITQLKRLDQFIHRRRVIAALYTEALSQFPELLLPVEPPYAKSAFHIYVTQLRSNVLNASRREVFEALRAENIGVQVHYIPIHYHPFYQRRFGCCRGDYPNAEQYYGRAITLPLFPAMSDGDVDDVIRAMGKVIAYSRQI